MTLLHITLTEFPASVVFYLLGVATGLGVALAWRLRRAD